VRRAEPDARWKIHVARCFEEVEQLRGAWQTLAPTRVDADFDYFLTVARVRPEVVRPHVVVLSRDGQAEAMVVARIEDLRLRCTVGYKTIATPRARFMTVVHGGVIGGDSESTCEVLLDELLASLERREADVVRLPGLRAGSSLHTAARTSPPFRSRDFLTGLEPHRSLRLPTSMDEFLATRSRKTRESVKRYEKRLLREHGDHLSTRILREAGDADRLFADIEEVAAKTYQRGLGVAFEDNEEHRRLTALGLERGWFRAYLLYLDDRPIAFWHGCAYNGTFAIGSPGYDPEFSAYRVGMFLQMRMIEDLCRDESIHTLDYGHGDAEYKRRFGSEDWDEADVLIFAPTSRGVALNVARTSTGALSRGARRVLAGTGLDTRLKRRWRRRLSAVSTG